MDSSRGAAGARQFRRAAGGRVRTCRRRESHGRGTPWSRRPQQRSEPAPARRNAAASRRHAQADSGHRGGKGTARLDDSRTRAGLRRDSRLAASGRYSGRCRRAILHRARRSRRRAAGEFGTRSPVAVSACRSEQDSNRRGPIGSKQLSSGMIDVLVEASSPDLYSEIAELLRDQAHIRVMEGAPDSAANESQPQPGVVIIAAGSHGESDFDDFGSNPGSPNPGDWNPGGWNAAGVPIILLVDNPARQISEPLPPSVRAVLPRNVTPAELVGAIEAGAAGVSPYHPYQLPS